MFISIAEAYDIFFGTGSPTAFDLKVFLLPEYLAHLGKKKDSVYFKSHKKGVLLLTKFYFILWL